MKVLLRDYVASLREREELDAILPDLLSELGYRVFSRPERGATQRGVDVGAVRRDPATGEMTVHLFAVKAGNLTRRDWQGSPQALRETLNEIQDTYLRQWLPAEYRGLKVVICLVVGGDIQQQIQDLVRGYQDRFTTDEVRFENWNGDRLAELLLDGVLREKLLPPPLRSHFQKAVAMVDEPETAYLHFARLAAALRAGAGKTPKARLTAARQLYICAWIVFAWARDAGNLEAAYRISELAILHIWELARPSLLRRGGARDALLPVVNGAVVLYISVAAALLEQKVVPHVGVRHGITLALPRDPLDVNLALFDILGRLALTALWTQWFAQNMQGEIAKQMQATAWNFTDAALRLIETNPALTLPIHDNQTVDIMLLLQAWLGHMREPERVVRWLVEMANRLEFAILTRQRYPLASGDYADLVDHPRDGSAAGFEAATAGSILLPTLLAWLSAFGATDATQTLATLAKDKLAHCAFQLWSPDKVSEENLYINAASHGRALVPLPVDATGERLRAELRTFVDEDLDLPGLSPLRLNYWPVVFLACRHHRLPIPPAFWIRALSGARNADRPSEQDG